MNMPVILNKKSPAPLTEQDKFEQQASEHLLGSMMEALHQEGFRLTPQRRLILKAIAQQVGWHVHAKEIYQWVRGKDPGIGLATVYRTLHMLEDMDLIQKIQMFAHAESAYPKNSPQHYHLVCTKTGQIMDAYDDLLETVVQRAAKEYNFRVTKTRLVLFGEFMDDGKQK